MKKKDKTASASPLDLTNKEKASLLYGHGSWHTGGFPKKGLPAISMNDGPCGIRKVSEKASQMDLDGDKSTCFPAPCLTACSWDPSLLLSIGDTMGLEAIAQDVNIILAPGCNIKRNPLCGRNFEYLSEDPLLAGKLAASFIEGVQSHGVGTSLKHFAVNSQEYHRTTVSAEVDVRALNEIYLRPFQIAVTEGKPWTVMCSYNKINGTYASDNDSLLKDHLRTQWHFDGVVMSDWGATNDPVLSHAHGLDLQMPCFSDNSNEIAKAVKEGRLKQADLDECAANMVHLLQRGQTREKLEAYSYGRSHLVAEDAAEKSAVLLSDDGILPLSDLSDCCVIGAFAQTPRYQGSGSSQITPRNLVSFLSAANAGRDTAREIPFAQGFSLDGKQDDKKLALAAVDLAASKKKVLLFLGLPASYESEGFDRDNMLLPSNQLMLFDAIYGVNKNIVVILSCGAPVELPFAAKARAILLMYLAGEASGSALLHLLLGKANPSGKLAESWPSRYYDVGCAADFPGNGQSVLYRESVFVGYRYFLSAKKQVLYPFGYGLSYTKFAYGEGRLSKMLVKGGEVSQLSFVIENIGSVRGEEVIELYTQPVGGKVYKPLRELRDFVKVSLKPGEKKKILFNIPLSYFEHYDPTEGRFVSERGDYKIEVGASCVDIRISLPIKAISDYVGADQRKSYPSYYAMGAGDVRVSDQEFEALLGHKIPALTVPHRPYGLNSTFRDISKTFIGRRIVKAALAGIDPNAPEQERKMAESMTLDSPIRFARMAGLPEYKIHAILDGANGRLVKALNDLMLHR